MEIKNTMDEISFSIKGLFLLLLALSANYFSYLLGPNINIILKKKQLFTNILLFSLIYFAISHSGDDGVDTRTHPITIFKLSLGVYAFFILLTKCEFYSTYLVLILLLLCYYNFTFYAYYKKERQMEKFEKLKNLQNYLYLSVILSLLIGVFLRLVLKIK